MAPSGHTRPRRVLVIGGSGGIGAAISTALADPSVELVIHGGSDIEKLRSLGDRLRASGCFTREIARPLERADDALEVLRESGDPDVLVVSFGPFAEAPIERENAESIRRVSELNYVLPASLIAAVLPGMRTRGRGRILVFGTTFGDRLTGFKQTASYAAAKTALASFVKSTARQVADVDVRCNMVCPGYVVTEYHGEGAQKRYAQRMPGGTAQSVDSIARLAKWLVSDENDAVNGAIVAADRGL